MNSLDIPFVQEGLNYSFPDNNFSIQLQPLSCIDNYGTGPEDESLYSDLGQSVCGHRQTDHLYLYEDRWFYENEIVKKRILARLGKFRSIFARKCIVVAVDGEICREAKKKNKYSGISDRHIKDFIERYHSYGYAKSKYRYALVYEGVIVAAAAFSASRPMPRETIVNSCVKTIIYDSYEWVRYVSMPDVRVVGGMGRLLKAFLKDIASRREVLRSGVRNTLERSLNPVEVMSYSDEEWSDGSVYRSLGFMEVARREPVCHYVDKSSYERLSYRKFIMRNNVEQSSGYYIIKNKGSRKFLLQLP